MFEDAEGTGDWPAGGRVSKLPKEPLRVALITACLGRAGGRIGGAERQAFYMARALAEAGVTLRVFSLSPGGLYEDLLRQVDVESRYFGWPPGLPFRLLLLLLKLRRFRPHIIQSVHAYTNAYSATAGRVLGAVSIGGLRSDLRTCLADNGRFGQYLLKWPDAIIVNSKSALEQIQRAKLLDSSRLHFLPNAIDLGMFPERSGTTSLARNGKCTCISVTRLFPLKRADIFVRALAAARSVEPQLCGVLVGFGPEATRLQQLAAELGLLPGALTFAGPCEDVATVLQQAEIFVFCSESEGTPNVVLEAMAAGLPVITTPAGDAADMVEPAGAGWVVPFGDVDATANAMVQLARSPARRRELGRAGRQYVVRHRDAADLGGWLMKIYRDVARSSMRGGCNDLLERVQQSIEAVE